MELEARIAALEARVAALEAPVPARRTTREAAPAQDSPEFTEFWELYPRKENKAAARKAWIKVPEWSATVTLALSKQLEAGMFELDRPKYIPMASTWLNQERWENPIVPKRKQAPTCTNVLDEWLEN